MGKQVRDNTDLLAIGIITIVLLVVVALSGPYPLRVIFGLPFVLLFPGYALLAALFPKARGISGLERLALSFGLSIALTVFIGLILNFTPWGIALYPILLSLSGFVVIASVIAIVRRRRLRTDERFVAALRVRMPSWAGLSARDRVLSIVLVLSVVAAIGAIGYMFAAPPAGEQFTEFYVLGPGGQAEDYPLQLVLGDEGRVLVGVVNHEGEETSYSLEVTTEGIRDGEVRPIVLGDGDTWEEEVSFVPRHSGESQKVEFLLYKGGESELYQTLHLFVDVNE
ncbi:MAG: DUF1616 domain-containing protein [Chloroflexota bacterium]|nr:DUF1616 domain-containing protein [Chloroflexota bacterium]